MKRYSISTDNGHVSPHFGRCPSYTFVDIENNSVVNRYEKENPGHSVGAIPKFLHENSANVIIAGGMGRRAVGFFDTYDIQPIVGISGSIDGVIETILAGKLQSGVSTCSPRQGKDYGLPKIDECDGSNHHH